MKKIITGLCWIAFFAIIAVVFTVPEGIEQMRCADKFITCDRYAAPKYNVIYERPNGMMQQVEVSASEYYRIKVGNDYKVQICSVCPH